jgi:branched-chain amino acid transport system ATP-binding protein
VSVILKVDSVTKKFGELVAVNNVSFDIREGEIVAIIGPNGAGKTTLLNLISGLLKPDHGRIIFRGIDITNLKPYQRTRLGIARTFQVPMYLRDLTVQEVLYAAILWKGKDYDKAIKKNESMLKSLGVRDYLWKKGEELTLIEEKKLELARALLQDPYLLLADEPAAGLRPEEIKELKGIIIELAKEKKVTVVIVEHVLKFVTDISDRIIVLNYGKKIAEGKPGEVLSNKEVIEAYLGVSSGIT